MYSEGKSDEGEFTSEVAASAKDAAASTLEEIERCSEDESDEDAGGLVPSSTEVQSTEANSLDAVPRNYPTLLPCHSCELILTSLDNYKKHCRERHYSYSCRFCDTMTASYGRLTKHLLICHPAAMKTEMRDEGNLESDEEEKSGLDDCDEPEPLLLGRSCKKKVRQCTKCGFASDDLVEFGDHMFNIHGDKKYKAKLINCPHCQFVAYIQHHMEYHINSKHLKQRTYKCDKCEYSGYNVSMLNSHTNSHSPIHRFRCEECNFVGKHSNLLKVHAKNTGHRMAPEWNKDGSLPPYLITADMLQRLINQKEKLGDASDISGELLIQVRKHIRSLDDEGHPISSAANNKLKIKDCLHSSPSVDRTQETDHVTTSRPSLPRFPGNSQPTLGLQACQSFAAVPAVANFSASMFQQQQQSLDQLFSGQYPQFPAFSQLSCLQQVANSNLQFNHAFAPSPHLQVSNQIHMSPTLSPLLKQQQQQQKFMMMMVAQMQQALYFNNPPPNLPNPAMGMYNVALPHPFPVAHMNSWPFHNGVTHNTTAFDSFKQKADSGVEHSRRKKPRQSRRTQKKASENNWNTLMDGNAPVASPLQNIKNEAVVNSTEVTTQQTACLLSSGTVGESYEGRNSVMTSETETAIDLSRSAEEARITEEQMLVESAEVSAATLAEQGLDDGTTKTRIETENVEDAHLLQSKVNDLKILNLCRPKRSLDSICERLLIKKLRKEDTHKQSELNE